VDVVSEAILATTVTFGDKSDPQSGPVTLSLAEANLVLAGSETEIEEAVMDKGYHDVGMLAGLVDRGVRTYIPERRQKSRCWTNKPIEQQQAFRASPAGARPEGPAVESLAQRTVRTKLCSCVRDRRRAANLSARSDQREQNAHTQMPGV
jgi:hypothetical protein